MNADVLILQASPRKGNGSLIAERLDVRLLEAGFAVRTERLSDYAISPCMGCGYCHDHPGFCRYDMHLEDRGRELLSLISGGSDIILVSPIWFYGLPAQLKALMDRAQTLWELSTTDRRPFPSRNKRLACVFTAARIDGERLFDAAGLMLRCFAECLGLVWKMPLTLRGLSMPDAVATGGTLRAIDAWCDDIFVRKGLLS